MVTLEDVATMTDDEYQLHLAKAKYEVLSLQSQIKKEKKKEHELVDFLDSVMPKDPDTELTEEETKYCEKTIKSIKETIKLFHECGLAKMNEMELQVVYMGYNKIRLLELLKEYFSVTDKDKKDALMDELMTRMGYIIVDDD